MNQPPHEVWAICRVRKADLCYFRYTLEAYEGWCVPTTLAGGGGRVQLATTAPHRAALEELLAALAEEMPLQVEGWHSAPAATHVAPPPPGAST